MAGQPFPSNSFVYKRVTGADPAAGIEVSDAVPTGKTWLLLAVTVQLVQGITQTPQPFLSLQDGGNVPIFESAGSTAAQAVSTTVRYTWALDLVLTGLVGATPNIRSNGALGSQMVLPPGFQIKTVTAGIGANSDYGAPSYYVCEFS